MLPTAVGSARARLSGSNYKWLESDIESDAFPMSNETESVPMKRFWFCTYREDVLFHATPTCPHLENNVTSERDLNQLAVAHIPVDAGNVGSPPGLNFCCCGEDDPFE